MINHMKRLGILCTQTLKLMSKPPVRSQKRGTVVTSEKDTPQPITPLTGICQAHC